MYRFSDIQDKNITGSIFLMPFIYVYVLSFFLLNSRNDGRRNACLHTTYPLFRDWASACTTFMISLQALEQASGDPLIVTNWKIDYCQ